MTAPVDLADRAEALAAQDLAAGCSRFTRACMDDPYGPGVDLVRGFQEADALYYARARAEADRYRQGLGQ